jgi:hypothetical protein
VVVARVSPIYKLYPSSTRYEGLKDKPWTVFSSHCCRKKLMDATSPDDGCPFAHSFFAAANST